MDTFTNTEQFNLMIINGNKELKAAYEEFLAEKLQYDTMQMKAMRTQLKQALNTPAPKKQEIPQEQF